MATLVGLENYARKWLFDHEELMPWLPKDDNPRRFEFFVKNLAEELEAAIEDRCIEWREQQAKGANVYPHQYPSCDDESCPCRKAEADDWRDQGAVRH